jgi:hypothetical protein
MMMMIIVFFIYGSSPFLKTGCISAIFRYYENIQLEKIHGMYGPKEE